MKVQRNSAAFSAWVLATALLLGGWAAPSAQLAGPPPPAELVIPDDSSGGDSQQLADSPVPDRRAPQLVQMAPQMGQTDVELGTQISIEFDEAIDPLTATEQSFALFAQSGQRVATEVSVTGRKVILEPVADLQGGTRYIARVSDSVADLADNALAKPLSWDFMTVSAPKGDEPLLEDEALADSEEESAGSPVTSGREPQVDGSVTQVPPLATPDIDESFTALEGATISGTITIPDGESGEVWLTSDYSWLQHSAVDSLTASFSFAGVSDGDYLIKFVPTSDHVATTYHPGVADAESATPVVVKDGGDVDGIDFAVRAASTVSGSVQLPAGESGTAVLLDATHSWIDSHEIQAEASGFTLSFAEDGQYLVMFQSNSQTVATTYYPGEPTWETAAALPLTVGTDVADVDFVALPATTLGGTIDLPDGAEGSIELLRADGEWVSGISVTAQDSTFQFGGVRDGTYLIEFQPYSDNVARSYYPGVASSSDATLVVVEDLQPVDNLEFSVLRATTVSGTVSMSTGQSGWITLWSTQGTWIDQDMVSSESPSFTLGRALDGDYVVEFSSEVAGLARTYYPGVASESEAEVITISGLAPVTGIDFAPLSASLVTGTVTLPQGTEGSVVLITTSGQSIDSDYVSSGDPTFELSFLEGGTHLLYFSPWGDNLATTYYPGVLTQDEAAPLTLVTGENLTDLEFPVLAATTISGSVGLPVGAEGSVSLVGQDGSWIDSDYVSSLDPVFVLSFASTGEYKLYFDPYSDSKSVATTYYPGVSSIDDAVAITALAGTNISGVDFVAIPATTVSGVVTLPDGESGYVMLHSLTTGWTDSAEVGSVNPQFTLGHAIDGDYLVEFQPYSDRVTRTFYPGVALQDDATVIAVVALAPVVGLEFAAIEATTISGTLELPDGAEGSVELLTSDSGWVDGDYVTSEDPGYSVSFAAGGEFLIQFRPYSDNLADTFYPGVATIEEATPLIVYTGMSISGVDFAPRPATTISGTVTLPEGEYGYVQLRDISGTWIDSEQVTAGDSEFTLGHVVDGVYVLEFQSPESDSLATTYYRGAAAPAEADLITVAGLEPRVGLDIEPLPATNISGTVNLPSGVDGYVELHTANREWIDYDHISSEEPSFRLSFPRSGSYVLSFQPYSSNELARTFYPGVHDEVDAEVLDLVVGSPVEGLNFDPLPATTVSGTIALADGAGGGVTLIDMDGQELAFDDVSSEDPSFVLGHAIDGQYLVEYRPWGDLSGARTYYPGVGLASAAESITVTSLVPVDGVDFAPLTAGTISGSLFGTIGQNVWVEAIDVDGSVRGYSYVDGSSGAYEIGGLAAGSYRVAFERASGFSSLAAQFFDKIREELGLGSATAVGVTAGVATTGVDALLTQGGTASGTVLDERGLPMAGAQVVAFTEDGSRAARSTQTDSTGDFVIKGLSTGNYVVAVLSWRLGEIFHGNVRDKELSVPVAMTFSQNVDLGIIFYEPETPSFTDVDLLNPFFTEIEWLASTGITTGYDNGTFLPWSSVDRAAMAAFLYRFSGGTGFEPPTTPTFTDVPVDNPFFAEIEWLASTGVTTGYADGTFQPWAPVDRSAMAAFLYRFAGSPSYVPPAISPFTDLTPTSPFYKEICWLASTGITTGYSDQTFRPWDDVNRGAMAAFLYRYVDRYGFPTA